MSGRTGGPAATIGRDVGRILEAFAAVVGVGLLAPLAWGEYYALAPMVLAGAIAFATGHLLHRRFRDAADPAKLHAMVVAAVGWFAVAIAGALPFVFVAWTVAVDPLGVAPEFSGRAASTLGAFRNPLNALFESMSGFTGTGLTMTDDESALPHALQWWRTLTEWVGGVGVIVLTTAILSRPGSGSLTLYESEARSEKIH
ncbi:MAG: potassium transporter TrkG, partial [Halobacteriaceae archaeon]